MNLDAVFGHTPKIYNIKDKDVPANAVNCMRPSMFGNPFRAYSEKDRDMVCDLFDNYVMNDIEYIKQIKTLLKGRDLVCCCVPKRCHCLTLLRVANED